MTPFPTRRQTSHLPTEKVRDTCTSLLDGSLFTSYSHGEERLTGNREVTFPECLPNTDTLCGADSQILSEGPTPARAVLMAYRSLLLWWGSGLHIWDGPGCNAFCNFCVLLFFVLASRRRHANVRLPQAPLWEGVGWEGLPDLCPALVASLLLSTLSCTLCMLFD